MYALRGSRSGELLTFGGKVIVHDNAAELAFLVKDAWVVRTEIDPDDAIPIWAHPDLASVSFPLNRSDFRCPR